MKKELYQKDFAIKFYEERYSKGYMDEWPASKKQRVIDVIRNLPLPATGAGLDFGCGNGVFTDVLKQALPNWDIYGCDISQVAINNAKERYPTCNFFVSDNEHPSDLKFDLLFSHHVLEHVFDIKKTISETNAYLKPESNILHILPCGNENSFEYNVCKLRTDGINKNMEDRFFFEDEGHVRRLTTEKANTLMEAHGFTLEKDLYSNQYYGALKWITRAPRFIMKFSDSSKAVDDKARKRLSGLRFKLFFLLILQLPAIVFTRINSLYKKKIHHYLILVIDFIPYLLSYPFYNYIEAKAAKEWKDACNMKNGSEMYLFYKRK
jgi:trans-aconitate methyltransferase